MSIITLPRSLKPLKQITPYPAHQDGPLIEEAAAEFFSMHSVQEWSYLPIEWTHLAVEYQNQAKWKKKWFGMTSRKVKKLNHTYKALVGAEPNKVFTIIQHDRGLHFHKSISPDKDLLVFGSGGEGDVPLPLLCDRREANLPHHHRPYLGSFMGLITHPAHHYPYREVLLREFGEEPFFIHDTGKGETAEVDYISLMAQSTFSFCPRGFGKTSFRLYEAFQQGSIPVYLYDEGPWLPFQEKIHWNEIAIIAHYSQCAEVKKRLLSMPPEEVSQMQRRGKEISKSYFSMTPTLKYVLEFLQTYGKHRIAEIREKTDLLRQERPTYQKVEGFGL